MNENYARPNNVHVIYIHIVYFEQIHTYENCTIAFEHTKAKLIIKN